MGFDSPSHWLILAVIVVVLFGYKKLPEMSRSVGRSLRIFKTEMKGMGDDDSARDAAETPQAPAVPPVPTQQAVPAVPVNPLVKPADVPEGTVPQTSSAPLSPPATVQPVESVPEVPQQQVQN